MQKAEPKQNQLQNQPAQRQGGSAARESPQGEPITQLEAMADTSHQVGKLAQLAVVANGSPGAVAQRKAIEAVHNSPNMVAQRQQLGNLMGKNSIPNGCVVAGAIVQRQPNQVIPRQDNGEYQVVYTGNKADFANGANAGGQGITGVAAYSARIEVTPEDEDEMGEELDVDMNARTQVFEKGHMLQNALGGTGNADNIFAQDGGQNGGGDWVSFETLARNAVRNADDNDEITFEATLDAGQNGQLSYNQNL